MTARARAIFDGDTASLSAALDRASGKINNMAKGTEKGVNAMNRMASAAAAVTTAGAAALQVWNDLIKRIDEAANRAQEAGRARRQALSLADTAADVQRISSGIAATRRETGIDEGRASELQFQLESLGLADQRQRIASLELTGNDPAAFATGLARTSKAFGISDPARINQLADLLFKGGKSSEVLASRFATAVAQAAPIAKNIGSTPEELSQVFAGVGGDKIDRLTTGLRALSDKILERGLGGQGLLAGADALSEQFRNDPRALRKALGSEAFSSFALLQAQRSSIDRQSNIASESAGSIDLAISRILSDPSAAKTLALQIEKQRADVREEDRFTDDELLQRIRSEKRRGAGGVAATLNENFPNLSELFFKLQGEDYNDNAGLGPGLTNIGRGTDTEILDAIRRNTLRDPATFQAGSQAGAP